ncbi:MAG: hypothetical protein C00003105_00910 [ANME-2 cluster archaeon HR1]|jgi:hypothetical protein|nr:MAG: hypothetical protein C5S41_05750 [ANME-2 cluster archaeon]KAF5428463.1 hypothetical protein C5S42_03265 [ANME-2 cluster archaeon]PPA78743.1 MAG: hypothetical protein C00003105_00910 [ANME-2 cluster archaeon HR1]
MEKMNSNKKSATILEDSKINVRIILAVLWVSHFLLWTFGDMLSLLQGISEPVANELLLFVAVPLAMIQTLMSLFSLIGKPKVIRWVNIGFASVFIVFNVGFLIEAHTGWEYLLGGAYLLFNVLIIGYAWKWPRQKN